MERKTVDHSRSFSPVTKNQPPITSINIPMMMQPMARPELNINGMAARLLYPFNLIICFPDNL